MQRRASSTLPPGLADLADPADPDRGAAIPRLQEGPSPQHLLVTLLGDYWLSLERDLPSAGLIELLGEFGISPASARAALNRLLRRGVVDARRAGRTTRYRLTGQAAERLRDGGRRIAGFGLDTDWDGQWTIVAFSLPEDRRSSRHLLRSRLRWFGFAPLYDALWVSASATAGQARALLAELEIATATVLRGTSDMTAERPPLAAWDLPGLSAVYDAFIAETRPLLEAAQAGLSAPRQALIDRTRLMDTYRRFPGMDPGLPSHHMPPGWPRDQARALFTQTYNALGPPAEARVRQILAAHDAEAAEHVRFQVVN